MNSLLGQIFEEKLHIRRVHSKLDLVFVMIDVKRTTQMIKWDWQIEYLPTLTNKDDKTILQCSVMPTLLFLCCIFYFFVGLFEINLFVYWDFG